MSKRVFFIGSPGPSRKQMLSALRRAGIEPRRADPDADIAAALETAPPIALLLEHNIPDRGEIISRIREREGLHGFPIVAGLRDMSEHEIQAALDEGADDFLLDDCPRQFEALVSILADSDSWRVIRAPKGLALLAEDDREERIRTAHVLKKIGFDVSYAASKADLSAAFAARPPRIVISSSRIAEEVFSDDRLFDARVVSQEVPWVVLTSGEVAPPDPADIPPGYPGISLVNKKDGVDGITFVTNELLTPAPPDVRRSKRLLYGAPVGFGPEAGGIEFRGFSYNINLGGLFVRTLTPLPHGSRIRVEFRVPFGKGAARALAQVVWVSRFRGVGATSSPPGMGLQIVTIAPPDKAAYEVGYELLLARFENRQADVKMEVDLGLGTDTTMPPPEWWSPISPAR